jgi:DNA-binding GntR family transcriptional regulator
MRELTLDSYIVETLMADLVGDDRQPSAFLVYLHLCSKIGDGATAEVSQRSIAEGTGLSKRAVQTALHHLERRRLISAHRESITAVARYTVHKPWVRRAGG